MNIVNQNGQSIAIIDRTYKIDITQAVLDLMADAWYQGQCTGMVLFQDSLNERFFDLKTGLAGEILQKFANYHFKMAIVGDFSIYPSESLKDFIYECNNGRHIFFKADMISAMASF